VLEFDIIRSSTPTLNRLAPNNLYICRAVSPLNGRTAIKVVGGGVNSGVKDKIPG